MRRFKINSASISPGKYEQGIDSEFMEAMNSVITLEDGSSLDLKKAVLLYDPDSHKIQLSDSGDIPDNFVQLATLTLTRDKPEVVEDESFEEPTEAADEEMFEEEEATENGDDEDEGEFFQ